MAERRVIKKKKKKGDAEEQPLSKDETEIAKYLRWNMPCKNSVMYGDKVQYFIGSKAVNFLLDSKWATGQVKSSVQFTDRESVCVLLDRFLMLGLISRVYRIRKEKKGKEKEKEKKKPKDDKEKSEQKSGDSEGADSPKNSPKAKKKEKDKGKEKDEAKDKKKKKVKVSLEPHSDQIFLDEDEAYVWIFDPVHPKTFVLGILVVLGVVAVCLFPLWPDSMREYSWYLSVLAAIFVGFIFFLAVLRYVVFAILWVLTFGKLHFWFLPNLTEDCGFFESFVPAYEYEYRGKAEETSEGDENIVETKEEKVEEETVTHDSDNLEKAADVPNDMEPKASEQENGDSSGSNRDTDENETEAWVKVKKADVDEDQPAPEVNC